MAIVIHSGATFYPMSGYRLSYENLLVFCREVWSCQGLEMDDSNEPFSLYSDNDNTFICEDDIIPRLEETLNMTVTTYTFNQFKQEIYFMGEVREAGK